MFDPLVTIIMPCYNGASTLRRAIDSVLSQKTEYGIRILLINDGSTDDSKSLMAEYVEKYSNVEYLENDVNLGNAKTFYKGLCNTQTKYYCVLDVDDYYTIDSKLNEQLLFLENDQKQEYVAVTHNYIIDFENGEVFLPTFSKRDEFNYIDFIKQKSGYYHTATYMYRNIFNGNPPDLFTESRFRGDTIRTAIHLMYSNKKVKVLPIVASAYCWNEKGIWSSLDQKKQFDIQIRIWSGLKELATTSLESDAYQKLIDQCIEKQQKCESAKRTYAHQSIDEVLVLLNEQAGKFAFSQKEFVFKGLYYSKLLDSCANSLGTITSLYFPFSNLTHNPNEIVIFVCTLNPEGGGIFREIMELIHLYPDKHTSIISTEDPKSSASVKKYIGSETNLDLYQYSGKGSKLLWLLKTVDKINPARCYFYDSHRDFYPYIIADRTRENICMFSYDHGFVTGLSIDKIQTIITKRPLDYSMLSSEFGSRVIYIPAWNTNRYATDHKYVPFYQHNELITASGAARFYKLNSAGGISYIDLFTSLLENTHGKHLHFGPIPDEKLAEIYKILKEKQIPSASFIHIPWALNPPKLLLEEHVDLFIEPFPIVSYKITMDMQMYGIPVISFAGMTRMSKNDFIYEGSLVWHNKVDFIEKCMSLTESDLFAHSKKSINYYHKYHSEEAVKEYYRENKHFQDMIISTCTDNRIREVNQYIELFNTSSKNEVATSLPYTIQHDPRMEKTILGKIIHLLIRINSAIVLRKKSVGPMINSNQIQELLSQNKTKEAYKLCLDHSDQAVCQGWLGRFKRDGIGTTKNMPKAIDWYTLSIKNNGPRWATTDLIGIYEASSSEDEKALAFNLCVEAANQGDLTAIGKLARFYRNGIGTPVNISMALKWYNCAYKKNLKWVAVEYVDLLLETKDVDKVKIAFEICNKYSESDNYALVGRLARLYRDGMGTDKDLDKAEYFMSVAKDHGVKWAESEYYSILLLNPDTPKEDVTSILENAP